MANASANGCLTELDGKLFGFDFTPTKAGSNFIHIDSVDVLSYVPAALDKDTVRGIDAFGDGVNKFVGAHPDVDVLVCVVRGYQNPVVSPYYEMDSSRSSDLVFNRLDSASDVPGNLHLLQ